MGHVVDEPAVDVTVVVVVEVVVEVTVGVLAVLVQLLGVGVGESRPGQAEENRDHKLSTVL